MSTVLMILGSLFISFAAILFMLAIEVLAIKNGNRPDWGFILPVGMISLIPILNIILLFLFGVFLVKELMQSSGFLFKIDNYIIKLIRGNNE